MANICPCTLGNSVSGALFNLKNAKKLNQQDQEEICTGQAVVLSRRVDTVYSLTRSSSSWAFLVKFRLASGEEPELKATEELYGTLKEGLSGTLTWQGDAMVSFQPEG